MNEIKESDQLKVFDKYGNKRLSNCWGDVTNLKDDDITNKLINNMIELLEELEKSYKDNIKIIRR